MSLKPKPTYPEWSFQEQALLTEIYSKKTRKEIAEMMKRDIKDVSDMIRKLGLHKNLTPLSAQEGQYIQENYPAKSIKEIAKFLQLPAYRVKDHIVKLGLMSGPRVLTNDENNFIKENYGVITAAEIGAKLDIPESYVRIAAAELGVTRTTSISSKTPMSEIEKQYIMDNYGKKTKAEMAKFLKRTFGSILDAAIELGLEKPSGTSDKTPEKQPPVF